MPKQSKALQNFMHTIKRSLDLVRLYIELVKSPNPPSSASDVVRSAVVLSVAAMDAYFTNKFVEMLVPYIRKRGPNNELIDILEKAGLDTEQALVMATMSRPFRRVRSLVQNYFEKYVTQKFDVIDKLFLCFGLKNLTKHTQGITKRKRLLRSIELLVERRHQIVHDGDLNSHGKLRRIDPTSVLGRIEDLAAFVEAADILLNSATKV